MKLIDIHTHILPNVDDGSKSIESSLKQLEKMSLEGIKKVFLTPHCMTGKLSYKADLYDCTFKTLQDKINEKGIGIELLKGAEVYAEYELINTVVKNSLTLGNSNYVLFETSLNLKSFSLASFIYELHKNNFKPILAHPERYTYVHKNFHILEEFRNRDVLFQINAPSLLGYYGNNVKNIAWKLLNKGWAHFIASDDHVRFDNSLAEAYKKVNNYIDSYTADLLFYDNPLRVYNNEDIELTYLLNQESLSHNHRKKRKKSFFEKLFR